MHNVILLGITSLLTDFSSEMVVPILPYFITALGGGGLALGLIFGIGDAVAALLRVWSGHIADRTKRYQGIVVLGYALSAFVKFFYVPASSWTQIAWIRPVERIGKGVRDAPRDAIVSESVPLAKRGHAFGVQRAFDGAGALLGAAAVLVLFVLLDVPLRTIFLSSAIVGLLAVIPIFLVRVPPNLTVVRRRVSFRKLTGPVRRFIAIATLFALGNFSIAFFILMGQLGFDGLSLTDALTWTLLAYIVLHLVDTLLSTAAGTLSDRIGRRRVIVVGYALFALVCIGFWLTAVPLAYLRGNIVVLFVLFALYGAFKAFIDASQRALVSDLSPQEVRGTALGTFETLTGLAAIPAGVIAGVLWNMAPAYPFLFGACVSLLAVAFLVIPQNGQR